MGRPVDLQTFTDADFQQFSGRINEQLDQLRKVLAEPGFGVGDASLGAELEMYLVDDHYLPTPVNEKLMALANDPQLTYELNRYNLEYNLSPVAAKGKPFRAMEDEMRGFLNSLQEKAQTIGAQIIPIGILPTLRNIHLSDNFMTDLPRYHLLKEGLCRMRGNSFSIDINGKDPLSIYGDGVTIEGANTSFQVHLRVLPDQFADVFNAAQLTTPLVLAMAANSPFLSGHRLWQETRIALFKQSIDSRVREHPDWAQPARVSFGHGWVRRGAWELFAENVALYQPLIPACANLEEAAPGELPDLNLHHGTVWSWNRAVYSHLDGGHLRIEFRAMPAGPTVVDMVVNAALAVGLAMSMRHSIEHYTSRLPFGFTEYNFYRAAQFGLDASVIWPQKEGGGLVERPIQEVVEELMPKAWEGLAELGVDADEIDRLRQIAEQRITLRQTGARWQLLRFEALRENHSIEHASEQMLKAYIAHLMDGKPVSEWPNPEVCE